MLSLGLVAGVENRAPAWLQLRVDATHKSSVNEPVKPAENEPVLDWGKWRIGRRNHAVVNCAEEPEGKSAGEDSEANQSGDEQCRNNEPDCDCEQ